MIKYYVPKLRFGVLNKDDINLDDCDNWEVGEMSFNTDNWNENVTRGYNTDSDYIDYMDIYLKDVDDSLLIELDICYTYDEDISEGDYWTPEYIDITNQDLWVGINKIDMLESDCEFDSDFYSQLEDFIQELIYSRLFC